MARKLRRFLDMSEQAAANAMRTAYGGNQKAAKEADRRALEIRKQSDRTFYRTVALILRARDEEA